MTLRNSKCYRMIMTITLLLAMAPAWTSFSQEVGPGANIKTGRPRDIDQYFYVGNAMQRTSRSGRYQDVVIGARLLNAYAKNPSTDSDSIIQELNTVRSDYENKQSIANNAGNYKLPQLPLELMKDFNGLFGSAGKPGEMVRKYGAEALEGIAGPKFQQKYQSELADTFVAAQDLQQEVWERLYTLAETNPSAKKATNTLFATRFNATTDSTAAQIFGANQDFKNDQDISWIRMMVGSDGILATNMSELSKRSDEQQKHVLKELDASREQMRKLLAIVNADEAARAQAMTAAKESALRTEGERASVYLMSKVLGLGDPKLGAAASATGNAILTVKSAVDSYSGNAASVGPAMAGAILSGNVASALFGVFSACSNSGPDTTEVILGRIGQLSDQIEGLRSDMHERFGKVDAELNTIFVEMVESVAELKREIGNVQAGVTRNGMAIEQLRAELAEVNADIRRYVAADGELPILLAKTKFERFASPSPDEFKECLSLFLTQCLDYSKTDVALRHVPETILVENLKNDLKYEPDYNFAFLLRYANVLGLLATPTPTSAPTPTSVPQNSAQMRNPVVWADGANAYIDVIQKISARIEDDSSFHLPASMTESDFRDHLTMMITAGEDILRGLHQLDGTTGRDHIAFCKALAAYYGKQSKAIGEQVAATEAEYKKGEKFGFDMWAAADQDYIPTYLKVVHGDSSESESTVQTIDGADVTRTTDEFVELDVPPDMVPLLKPFALTSELKQKQIRLLHYIAWAHSPSTIESREAKGKLVLNIYCTAEGRLVFYRGYTKATEIVLGERRAHPSSPLPDAITEVTRYRTLLPQAYVANNWTKGLELRKHFLTDSEVRLGDVDSNGFPMAIFIYTKAQRADLVTWGNTELAKHRKWLNALIAGGLQNAPPDPLLKLDGLWAKPELGFATLAKREADLEAAGKLVEDYMTIARSSSLSAVRDTILKLQSLQVAAMKQSEKSLNTMFVVATDAELAALSARLDLLAASDPNVVARPTELVSTTLFRLRLCRASIGRLSIARNIAKAKNVITVPDRQ